MKNYDPNFRRGIHKVKITLQQWDYVGHVIINIHGNIRGFDVICGMNFFDFSVDDIEEFENDCNLTFDDDNEIYTVVLKNNKGDTLLCEEDGHGINQMIVAVKILDFVEG